jgi:ParB-like chromosome segregation protein Spo0J
MPEDNVQATLEQALDQADSDGELTEELLLEAVGQFFDETDDMEEQVSVLNSLRERLHESSPFNEPVENIKWVDSENVTGNDYNPNEVATPEMELLHKSIKEDGYTQPIVTYQTGSDRFEIVDGEHRSIVGKEFDDIRDRLHGFVPVTVIDKPEEERMSSTIRHNRARGTHQIRDMSDIVVELFDRGWDDERIMEELGMERDEVLRLKQVSGLKKAFSDHEFSESWTEYKDRHEEEKVEIDD